LEDDAVAGVGTVGELRALLVRDAAVEVAQFPAASVGSAAVMPRGSEDIVYPRWPWSWLVGGVRGVFLEVAMRPLVWVLAGPRVVRRGELPVGPVLVIANHVTAYDGALVMYGLPGRLRRRMACAMSGEMLGDLRRGRNQGNVVVNLLAPVGYWLVTALFNVFPLPRLRGFQRSFAFAGEAMDRGYSVLIFPEGTRSRDGEFHAFRAGIGLLALQSGVPVVPVALVGLGEMRKTGWFRSGRLEVRVGEAIRVPEGMEPARVTAMLEARLKGLLQWVGSGLGSLEVEF
jgi:long-chain acyl-CoA synthetase